MSPNSDDLAHPVEPVFIALGSNLDDRHANLNEAIAHIAAWPRFEVIAVAPFYDSDPMYVSDQPQFLNSVLQGRAFCTAPELLTFLKDVEGRVGRRPTFRNGPRIIDLDIVYFGDERVSEAALEVPHPRRLERDFVLQPLCDLMPGFIDPDTKAPVSEALVQLKDPDVLKE